jgi:O-antigen/teichoic acid export membrane protein
MLRLGLPLFLVTLVSQAQQSADLLAVGLALGPAAAAPFYLAAAMMTAGCVFANAGGQLTLSRMARWRDEPAAFATELERAFARAVWLGALLASGAALAMPTLVTAVFGNSYVEAIRVAGWLLPWLFLQHPTTVLMNSLAAGRAQRDLLGANVVMAAAMALALAPALAAENLAACALARSISEIARLAVLLRSLPPHTSARLLRAAAAPTALAAATIVCRLAFP